MGCMDGFFDFEGFKFEVQNADGYAELKLLVFSNRSLREFVRNSFARPTIACAASTFFQCIMVFFGIRESRGEFFSTERGEQCGWTPCAPCPIRFLMKGRYVN